MAQVKKKIILASGSPGRKALLSQMGKAKDVAQRHKNAIIIAADTFCVLGKEILGKPHTKENAKIMLQKLSGKKHAVITGFTIIDTETGRQISKSIETEVIFSNISEKDIDDYISLGEPLDKAGAYAMQHRGGIFVERIEGDYFNIVGLPLPPLVAELKFFGINVFKK